MIEVFRTNVTRKKASKRIREQLLEILPGAFIHFDLEDCDKILRIERREQPIDVLRVIEWMKKTGFECELLND